MYDLTPLKEDALLELFNIGMGRAAASIGSISEEEVKLSVPVIRFVSRMQAAMLLTTTIHETIWSVRQEITGDFDAEAILIFSESNSLQIAHLLTQNALSDADAANIQDDALLEVGNIILNACIGSVTNMLGTHIFLNMPHLQMGSCADVLKIGILNDEDIVMLVQIQFEIESRDLSGHLAFVQEEVQTRRLLSHVEAFVNSI